MKKFSFRFEHIFIACMFLLFLLFCFSMMFKSSGKGTEYVANQQNTFIEHADEYVNFHDYALVAAYSVYGNPYFNNIHSPNDRPYLPLSYILFHYTFSKVADYSNLGPFEATRTPLGILVASLFILVLTVALFIQLYAIKKGGGILWALTVLSLIPSGIFLINYEIGNLSFLSVNLIVFFILNYKSDNKILKEFCLISLALAGAFKISPLFLSILLLYDKQYKSFVKVALYFLILGIIPFFIYKEGFVATFSQWIFCARLRNEAISFPIDLELHTKYTTQQILKFVTYTISIIGIPLNYFQKCEWKRISFLICAFILLSSSGITAALYLLPIVILFLNEKQNFRGINIVYLFSFIIFLSPYQIFKFLALTTSFLHIKVGFMAIFFMLFFENVSAFIKNRKK